jgi:hypothetical protein
MSLKSEIQRRVLDTVGTLVVFRLSRNQSELVADEVLFPEIDQVKAVHHRWQKPFGIDVLYEEPEFRPLQESKEMAYRAIVQLPDRYFFIHVRGEPGTYLAKTPDVLDVEDIPTVHLLPEALKKQDEEAYRRFGALRDDENGQDDEPPLIPLATVE